jgi:hypothetical protein
MTTAYEKIKEIYKTIPEFKCKPGCHDCCGLIVMTKIEYERIVPCVFDSYSDDLTCPHVSANGCRIYENRPTICRLFGAVDAEFLTCPHGCGPVKKISNEQAKGILRKVHECNEQAEKEKL